MAFRHQLVLFSQALKGLLLNRVFGAAVFKLLLLEYFMLITFGSFLKKAYFL